MDCEFLGVSAFDWFNYLGMEEMMGDKNYKFRPSNWNLEEYIASRYHVSRMKREQSAHLKLQADAIDDELQELQKQLEEK